VRQAISGNAELLITTDRNRVVEPDALDEATVPRIARISGNDVEKRALLGAAAG
jgi:hypothetical protein